MTLAAHIIPRCHLTPTDREAMFRLMDRHYENMRRSRFDADLAEKDWVILLTDSRSGEVRGFSTQVVLSLPVAGRPVRVVFSGDTIVDREHWGSTTMAIAWGKLAFHFIEQFAGQELYWYLLSKGYRTYRFLPVYFREFYPRHDAETPRRAQAVLDAVAQGKYAGRFDPVRGLVRASEDSDRLRPGLGDIREERLLDPHLRFFQERNPDHARGDELCCVAPLTLANFSAVAERLIRSPAFARQRLGVC